MLETVPPRNVGPYEVISIIGRGGIGTVYRALHRQTRRQVALKLVGPPPACDPGAARRLAREFEALERLDHPNVVRVYEAGVYESYSFLAMELVEGLDLRSYLSPTLDHAGDPDGARAPPGSPAPPSTGEVDTWSWSDEPPTEGLLQSDESPRARAGPAAIRAFAALMDEPETDGGRLPAEEGRRDAPPCTPGPPESRPLSPAPFHHLNGPARLMKLRSAMLQVCQGLGYVHAHGLVHRDLKPANIMVDDARRVRLMDFGLVKVVGGSGTLAEHGNIVGTYRYMAPEQARGEPLDHRADLYSVGVILFELICGRPPFVERRPSDLWQAIVNRPAPAAAAINPGVDARLAHIVERLLAKHPQERFQCAADVASALRG